ncbi:MAG: DNA repair protein RecN [Victivallaceae bacterium]|nr:DNA repair protein RecN [Victivallaceae bacterium]
MLEYLSIRDFALIEKSEIELSCGFNVVTGESGAGKSILMAAAALLFGGRADRAAIRTGASFAEVSGVVGVPENLREKVSERLREADVPVEFPLTIRRKIQNSGVRNFVNDTSVGVRLLGEIGAMLADFHAATDQLDLAIPARQLEMLDRFAGLAPERDVCRSLDRELASLGVERENFEKLAVSAENAEILREMVETVDRVNPAPDEEKELSGRYRLIVNAREVLELCDRARGILDDGEGSVVDRLGETCRLLTSLERLAQSPGATEKFISDCERLQENAEDLARRIADLAESTDLDAEALQSMEARLEELHALKRRYGVASEEELLEKVGAARAKLAKFSDAAACRAEFDAREKALRAKLDAAAEKLSAHRRKGAVALVAEIKKNLADIGFTGCRLEIEFSRIEAGSTGCDQMEIVFSANAGEDARPLRKIASSGELARFMLAFKTVLADADDVPTVVFDEIDMNIGGETAHRVGEKLRALGAHRQILCISHLAQVAARADHHFQVGKTTENGRTVSRVVPLSDPVPELARMLGGGESALRHAADLAASVRRKTT